MESTNDRLFTRHTADTTFVTFCDEDILNEKCVKELEQEIVFLIEHARRQKMVLDFCNVKHLTSAFLGFLVKIHTRIREKKGYLKLRNVDPAIYKIFKITGLNKILDIRRTSETFSA